MYKSCNFASLLLIISLISFVPCSPGQTVLAKTETTTLQLLSNEINGSVFDSLNNILVIKGALELDTTVSIKPTKRTLTNGMAVKIEGELNADGDLIVDLTKLGPPNLIPTGEYVVTATSANRKIKAKFNYIAPTLIVGRLQVAVPDPTGAVKARIERYQTSGETVSDIPQAQSTLYDKNHNPVNGVITTKSTGTRQVIDNQVFDTYEIYNEIVGKSAMDLGSHAYITVETKATNATGDKDSVVLSAPVFVKSSTAGSQGKVKASRLNNVGDINVASTVASKYITAIDKELEDTLDESSKFPNLQGSYKAVFDAVQPGTETARTVSEGFASAPASSQANTTEIIATVGNDLANQLDLQTAQKLSNIPVEVTWKGKSIIQQKPKDIAEKGIEKLSLDSIAVALTDPTKVNVPKELTANAYVNSDAIVGSGSLDKEAALNSLKEFGSLPPINFNASSIKAFKENIIDSVNRGEIKGFNSSQFSSLTVTIPPGFDAKIDETSEILNSIGLSDSSRIKAAPGSIIQGDPEKFKGEILAQAGAFVQPGFASVVKFSEEEFKGSDFTGLIPNVGGIGFIPKSFENRFNEGMFDVISSFGETNKAEDSTFTLDTGRQGQASSNPTGSISSFNPAQSGSKLQESLTNLGSKAKDIIGENSIFLAGAFNRPEFSTGSDQTFTPLPSELINIANSFKPQDTFTGGPAITVNPETISNAISGQGSNVFSGSKPPPTPTTNPSSLPPSSTPPPISSFPTDCKGVSPGACASTKIDGFPVSGNSCPSNTKLIGNCCCPQEQNVTPFIP